MSELRSLAAETSDELHEAQLEIRHLKDTLGVLRDELESMRMDREEAVQQAVQRSVDEIQQLKSTVTSLRDELESLRIEKDAAVQETVQRSAD